jgi:hypothetical protein
VSQRMVSAFIALQARQRLPLEAAESTEAFRLYLSLRCERERLTEVAAKKL